MAVRKRYPSLPPVTDDPRSHTLALNALRDAVEVHERRRGPVGDSFVRMDELAALGVVDITSIGTVTSGSVVTSGVPLSRIVGTSGSLTGGGNLSADRVFSLVNDSLSPGNSYYYGTNGAGTKGFYALPTPPPSADLAADEVITGYWRAEQPFSFGQNLNVLTTPMLAAYSSGMFSSAGDAQAFVSTLRYQTTDATPTPLTVNGSPQDGSNVLNLPDNCTWIVSILLAARNTANQDSAVWRLEGMIDRGTGAASVTASEFVTHTVGADQAWTVAVGHNTTYGSLQVQVTGVPATTIRWMAKVDITQVRY